MRCLQMYLKIAGYRRSGGQLAVKWPSPCTQYKLKQGMLQRSAMNVRCGCMQNAQGNV